MCLVTEGSAFKLSHGALLLNMFSPLSTRKEQVIMEITLLVNIYVYYIIQKDQL